MRWATCATILSPHPATVADCIKWVSAVATEILLRQSPALVGLAGKGEDERQFCLHLPRPQLHHEVRRPGLAGHCNLQSEALKGASHSQESCTPHPHPTSRCPSPFLTLPKSRFSA
mmetsp:Transcript_2553/g.6092  ORF Transcript_2553/g.6092 Transcript_2553/m.6092 type:complete len:116 (+) Transcript_2553:50-397(+)